MMPWFELSVLCIMFLASIEIVFESVERQFTIKMQNETLHDMTRVVKRGTPPRMKVKTC